MPREVAGDLPHLKAAQVVAVWAVLAGLAVAGACGYLAFVVHAATLSRHVAVLEQELQVERWRGERLELELARALSPGATEAAARTLLAMGRPQRVELVVMAPEVAGAAGGGLSLAQARWPGEAPSWPAEGRRAERGAAGGWLLSLRGLARDALSGSLALARRLPQWP